MTNIEERNKSGQYYVSTRIGTAKTRTEDDFPEFSADSPIHSILTNLIEVEAKGFRGVVITALTGLYLDKDYDPLNNFYGCNPRSIFESGIWYALQENDIPCGKSDPLNVAKNANQPNEDWAQGKRPQAAAMAVVDYLQLVMEANQSERARLIDYFFFRLWKYSQTVSGFQVVQVVSSDHSNQVVASKLAGFTLKYPESGTMPQYLVAQLLNQLSWATGVVVMGGDESVFGTNTTSKKPADIWLESNGVPFHLYEVTVKPITLKRLDDSLQALDATGYLNHPITFICRLAFDVKDLGVSNGSMEYRGKRFDFVDYEQFCLSMFSLLAESECSAVLDNVATLVRDKNTSLRTKSGWNEYFNGDGWM